MRIDRNINKYFDRMEPNDVSLLWGGMLEFRHRIVSMEHIMSGGMADQPEDKHKAAKAMAVFNMLHDTRAIDSFMNALGLGSLFGTEDKKSLTDDEITEIIDRYHYLMDEIK